MRKLFISIMLLLAILSNVCFASIDKKEVKAENELAFNIVTSVVLSALTVWGFNQKSTYGNTTGLLFGIGAYKNILKIKF